MLHLSSRKACSDKPSQLLDRRPPRALDLAAGAGVSDALTILTTFGPLATKVLGPGQDGLVTVLEGYGLAEHFRVATAIVHGLAELLALLEHLATCRRSFLIRGEPLPGTNPRRCKRLLHDK